MIVKKNIKLILLITLLCFGLGCTFHRLKYQDKVKLIFPETLDTISFTPCPYENAVIYYFEGNCSACYMTLKKLEQNYNNTEIVGITFFEDTALILYQFDLLNIDITFLHDRDSMFFKRNAELFKSGNIFVVDSLNYVDSVYSNY